MLPPARYHCKHTYRQTSGESCQDDKCQGHAPLRSEKKAQSGYLLIVQGKGEKGEKNGNVKEPFDQPNHPFHAIPLFFGAILASARCSLGSRGSVNRGRALIDRFTQRFAWLEMWHSFLWNCDTFTAARVAPQPRRSAVNRKTSKSTNFNSMTPHQCVVHGIENRLNGVFGVTVGELGKLIGQLFNEV